MSARQVPPGEGWTEVHDTGFVGLVGPLWTRTDGETLQLGFFVDDRHGNRAQRLHGGMLVTVADRAMGMCARLKEPDRNHATISLSVDFMDSAVTGEFVVASPTIRRETQTLCFLRCDVAAADRLLASVQGVWKKLR